MARMYARRRGKSGSKKSLGLWKGAPEWLEMSAEDVEQRVVALYNQGLTTSEIGIELRDANGIPSVAQVTGNKMTAILNAHNVAPGIPEDLQNLMRKALRIRKHIEGNKKDVHNKRALQLTESKIRRLEKYYRRDNVLAADWHYKPETAKFVLRR